LEYGNGPDTFQATLADGEIGWRVVLHSGEIDMSQGSTRPLSRLYLPAIIAGILTTTFYTPLVSAQIEEVIVTAQRTEESIQDVPIAVTALTGDMLADRQIINPSDIQLNVPNVSFSATNFGGQNFSIRGIGRLVTAASGEAGVSTHINEISIGTNLTAIEFYDISRV